MYLLYAVNVEVLVLVFRFFCFATFPFAEPEPTTPNPFPPPLLLPPTLLHDISDSSGVISTSRNLPTHTHPISFRGRYGHSLPSGRCARCLPDMPASKEKNRRTVIQARDAHLLHLAVRQIPSPRSQKNKQIAQILISSLLRTQRLGISRRSAKAKHS